MKITFLSISNVLMTLVLSLFITIQLTGQCDSGLISGQVFSDSNNNGSVDNTETGVSGIRVRAYNDQGLLVGQSLSSGNGSYQVSGLSDGDNYTIVFDVNNQFVSAIGPDNNSDVQVITVPNCTANIGVLASESNCNTSTELLMTCFVNGVDQLNLSQETILGIQHNFNGSSPVTVYATQRETGSIWGLSYDSDNDVVYSAAFVKQNTALGTGGHDAIYQTSLSGTPSTTLLTTLSSLGQNVGSLSVTDYSDCDYGNQVGRIGLGAMDIDDEGNNLYVVNLHDRTLVSVDINNPNPGTTNTFNIPNPGCTFNDYRPFAVNYYEGEVYVGVTCTAETSGDDFQTSFHVYRLNINSGNFSLDFSTDFLGGHWNDTPDWKQASQWLTDLEFTDEGHMVLGISDRIGHRFCNATTSRLDEQFGEILLVANVNGQWILENNGQAANLTGTGVNNNDGPGGGEFFGDDFFPANPSDHHNIATGSIAIVPGVGDVVATVFDPIFNTYSGGLHRYSTTNGSKLSSQELYNRNISDYFGKASGFGDIVTRCGAINSQIGNLVWSDDNCDGIQNANERGISGVVVNLYDENCNQIATTTTDSNGQYTFTDNIAAGQTYSVALDAALYNQSTASYTIGDQFYFPTVINNDNNQLNSNLSNSSICFDSPSIDFITKTGNNSGLDIGLKTSEDFDLALTKTLVNGGNISLNDIIEFEITIHNQGGIAATSYEIVDYLTPAYEFDQNRNPGWIQNGDMALLSIDELLPPGQSRTHTIRLAIRQSDRVDDYINIAEISQSVDANGNLNSDVDSKADTISDNDAGGQIDTDTDNNIDDNGLIDEDDQDPAQICIADLALRNVLRNTATIYRSGDLVTFDYTVFNQGNVSITAFDIVSHFPSELDFDTSLNPDWEFLQNGLIRISHSTLLLPGDSESCSVTFRLNDTYEQQEVVVVAEISDFGSSKADVTIDFDSTPDAIFGNDNGGIVNSSTDNMINDNGTNDEDDEDPASLSPFLLDLALMNTTQSDFVEVGDVVAFNLQVHNQGEVTVSSLSLVNLVPEGFRILDTSWTQDPSDPSGNTYSKIVNFPNGFIPGAVTDCTFSLEVLDSAKPGYNIDFAEISSVTDMSGNNVSDLDIDSNADNDLTNDVGGVFRSVDDDNIDDDGTTDEDDQDPAGVYLATVEIRDPCVCKSNATDAFNGQFDEQVVVTGPPGQTWYIDFAFDIFSPTSAAPPAAPTPFVFGPMGFQLVEVPINSNVSEYLLDGIIVDDRSYSVRVTNGLGAFLQISGGGSACTYDEPVIMSDGLSAVCNSSTFTYCIDPIAGCTAYDWSLSGGGVISGPTDTRCVTVVWGAAAGGPHRLQVQPVCTAACIAPGVADISVGMNSGPLSCRSQINVSLDDNCRTQLTPQQFLSSPLATGVAYQLMVTDHLGNIVPNSVLTDSHLFTSLTVKVINPCDGNSCWSTINVEDKLGPVIQCDTIAIPCFELDNYMPLVRDNCSNATVELVAQTITPLTCDPDFIQEVNRRYIAIDEFGNRSTACDQLIQLERFPIDSIVFPDSLTLMNMNNLTCNDTIFDVDGRPRLDLTGVPTLFGRPLLPQGDFVCNFFIDFTDFTLSTSGCSTKVLRTFRAYEDWCSNVDFIEFVQVIEIVDDLSPTIECPTNITVATDGTPGCQQTVRIPLPEANDDCTDNLTFDISFPGGFISDVTTPQDIELNNGVHEITFNVFDECLNSNTCVTLVTVEDRVNPVAICDRSTSVSLRSNGTAKVFASTFDDGSFDDCELFDFVVRRVNSNCDCGRPEFDNMNFLGNRNGRLYYISNFTTNASTAFAYASAYGGMILREESCAEHDWVFEQVNAVNAGATYYTGITDKEEEGVFTFTNHAPVACDVFADPINSGLGDNVIVDVNGNYTVVNGSLTETYFIVELSDPCGFSDEVLFCCADIGEQMVVFRAIDKGGLFNDCMVSVTVQDKVAPTITCPADRDIDCSTPINFADLSEFGIATASDSCAFTITEDFTEGVNACGQGMITRVFTATDNGGSNSCTQSITLVNPTPFSNSSVILPLDFTTDTGCNSGDLQPENLPVEFGLPRFEQQACSMIGITFEDQTFSFAGPDTDACLKIVRTYTIIDWCQADDPGYEPLVHEQSIAVNNIVGPVILSGCEDLDVTTVDCDFGEVDFTITAQDDCTPDDRLRTRFELRTSDGKIFIDSVSSNSYNFTGSLPLGVNIALTSFSDLCGNVTTCTKIINVINITTPTAACVDGLSIGLVPWDVDGDGNFDNERACIFPEMIDASSTHICGLPIKLSFSSDTSDVKRFFDCDDLGDNEVELWVTICVPGSDSLVQSFCTTTVEVQDNNNVDFCPNFDLALRKTLSASNVTPFQPGDAVTFDITVINQGNVPAFNVGLIDYVPNGLTLNDAAWMDNGNGVATLITPIPFVQDSTAGITVPITFTIDADNPGMTITNLAEISFADDDMDPNNEGPIDDDSTPDTDPDDGTVTDDAINNENGDEDDHDPADLVISVFDLALTKMINMSITPGPFNPGDDVSFVITLFNQGNVDATDIVVTDYIPAGFTLNTALSPGFSQVGNNAETTVSSLAGGSTMSVGLTLTIDSDFADVCLVNNAEITAADNADNLIDQDSPLTNIAGGNNPELGSDNDITDDSTGGVDNPNDQDDYDPAKVDIECNLPPICNSVSTFSVTLDNNGMASIDVSDINNGSFAQCTNSTIVASIDINSFDCSNSGSGNIVTLTITDSNGQTSSCQTDVSVIDDQDPTLQCQSITTTLNDDGTINLDGVVVVTSSSDNCSVSNPSFDITNIDLNTIQCVPQNATATVSDPFGNTATCMFTIIIENDPPVARCNDFTLILNDMGVGVISPATINNGSSDDCTMNLDMSLNQTTFGCSDIGLRSVILTVTDEAGLSSTCLATIDVQDETPPTAVCSNITINLDSNGNAFISPNDIDNGSSDACSGVTLALDRTSFTCMDMGSTTVVLTATDASGNSSQCSAIVSIVDMIPPTLTCVADFPVQLDTDGMVDLSTTHFIAADADNCGIVTRTATPTLFNCANKGVVPVTVTVTDGSNNSAQCVVNVTVEDNLAPTCALIPNQTFAPDEIITSADILQSFNDNCATTSAATTIMPNSFTCADLGMQTVTVTVDDGCGNTGQCMTQVNIVDQATPICAANAISVCLDADGNYALTPADMAAITAGTFAGCDMMFTTTISQTDFDCSDVAVPVNIVVTLTTNSTTTTCNSTVTVIDKQDPVVTCAPDMTIDLDANGQVLLAPGDIIVSAVDNCPIMRTIDVALLTCTNKDIPTTVTATVTDGSGNTGTCSTIVTVEDNTAPTCSLLTGLVFAPNTTITVADVFDTFSDNCATQSSATTIAPSIFTCMQLGMQTVTVTVNDDCGNSSTCTTTVDIVDMTTPVCAANDISVCLDADGTYQLTAADMAAITNGSSAGCDVNFTTTISQTEFSCSDTDAPVDIEVTLVSGSFTTTCDATVTVIDKQVPVVTCAPDMTLDLDANGQASLATSDIIVSTVDNCPVTSTIDVALLTCMNKDNPTTVTATATDGSGNVGTCTTVVTVEDNIAPTCTLLTGLVFAPNTTISVSDVFDTFNDNCATQSSATTIIPSTFTCMQLGMQTVTVTVNDDCGNSSTCTTTVDIVDMTTPVCAANDITVCLDANGEYTLTQMDLDALTNGSSAGCDAGFTLDVDIVDFLCNDTNVPVTVTVTLTSGGVATTCTAQVTVLDKIPPTITCVPDLTLDLDANGQATITPSMIIDMADDNCSFTQTIDVSLLDCSDKDTPTIVTATITDQAQNTATCTSTVTVEDNMAPTCTLTTGLIFPPNVTITVDDVLASFMDNCATASVNSTIMPSIFTCMQLGTQTVTVTVDDGCGNTSTCSVDVSIQDNSVPTAVCQDITVNLDALGEAEVDGVDVDGGSFSACGSTFTFSVNPNIFDCTDVGPNIVILTVTSTGGTSSTCTAVVTILDSTPPIVVCPADQSLVCNTDISNLSIFGNATAVDNCTANVSLSESADINVNLCNVGTVTRTFTALDDFGNSSTCDQVITINPSANAIDDSDITPPPGIVNFNQCFDPNNLVTQGPIVDTSNADCFSVTIDFTDSNNSSNIVCNGQITRTWEVIDSCQSPVFVRTFDQLIILDDTEGPMITGPDDVTIVLDPNATVCEAFVDLPATVTDCVPGFSVTNNSPFANNNNSADASGIYPAGTTNVRITAVDVCGSTSVFDFSVTILDPSASIKSCDKIIATIQSTQSIDIDVSQTNADVCSICPVNTFNLSWSNTDPNVPIMNVDCSFIGITNYTVYLWQNNMLLDSCTNLLQVFDGGNFCTTSNFGEVAGRIYTENNKEIEDASVRLVGSELPTVQTNAGGIYAFNNMPFGGEYSVRPTKDIDYLNGVSTADLIGMQRHILGSQLLDSPYKIIAADVNNSGDVSALDLIELRRLILGVQDEFVNNDSWRLINAEHTFIDELNPFATDIPDDQYIGTFDESMLIDFIGVKIGDVNNSVVANLQDQVVEKRSINDFSFDIEEQKFLKGTTANITFGSKDLETIDGLQLSLIFNTNRVELVDFISEVSDLTDNNINRQLMEQGVLNMSWNRELLTNDEDLFTIVVRVKSDSWTSELMSIATTDYIPAEAYGVDGLIKDIDLTYINKEIAQDEFVLYQNLPNPWVQNTSIKYYISNADRVSLNVYDVNGKLLLNKAMDAVSGLNSFEIGTEELSEGGVMYYEVISSTKKDIEKMILIR